MLFSYESWDLEIRNLAFPKDYSFVTGAIKVRQIPLWNYPASMLLCGPCGVTAGRKMCGLHTMGPRWGPSGPVTVSRVDIYWGPLWAHSMPRLWAVGMVGTLWTYWEYCGDTVRAYWDLYWAYFSTYFKKAFFWSLTLEIWLLTYSKKYLVCRNLLLGSFTQLHSFPQPFALLSYLFSRPHPSSYTTFLLLWSGSAYSTYLALTHSFPARFSKLTCIFYLLFIASLFICIIFTQILECCTSHV